MTKSICIHEEIPNIPGYVSIKEAARMLGISDTRVYMYIEKNRLPAVRATDVFMISLEDIKNFKRHNVGRPRRSTPLWRVSSGDNTLFKTTIQVKMRPGQQKKFLKKLEEIKQSGQQLFPGTIARYIAGSETVPEQVEITLIWRSSIMPPEHEREQALQAFRLALADVLDWNSAHYSYDKVYMHT